jgi:hypothetical protein
VGLAAMTATRPRSGHRDTPARFLAHAIDHVDAHQPHGDDRERGGADHTADRRRGREQRPHQHTGDDEHDQHPLEHRRQRADEEGQRPLRAGRDITQDEDHRLDCDPADQVSGREIEVPLHDRRDRDRHFRQAARDREQQDPTELIAEAEADVERVGCLREGNPHNPGRDGAGQEDHDEQRGRDACHRVSS